MKKADTEKTVIVAEVGGRGDARLGEGDAGVGHGPMGKQRGRRRSTAGMINNGSEEEHPVREA